MKARGQKNTRDLKKKALAETIAKEVLECDSSILSLLVVNSRGEVLAVGRSERLAKSDYLDESILPKLGVVAKLITGAADQESALLGRMEFLIGAFKNQKIVLIDVPKHDLSLALRMSRSSIAEYVCNKIGVILAKLV